MTDPLPHEWPADPRDPLVCVHGCGCEPGDVLIGDECPRRLRAALEGAVGERGRWQDTAYGRKVDLQNADTTLLTVRFALGYDPAGNGWRPPRGVDPVVDLALDARADSDALAAIRRYFTATSDLAREEFAAEWEAIPEEDRARFQAWGDRAYQAGIDAGEDALAEVEKERDRLRVAARSVIAVWDGEYEDDRMAPKIDRLRGALVGKGEG